MTLLIASLVALALGPWVLVVARRSASTLSMLDGFVYVAIFGLVVLHVLPDAYDLAGWWVLPAAAVGLAGPSLVERRMKHSARRAHAAALVLACIGLGLHGLLDGIALAGPDGGAEAGALGPGAGLALAIVLHRLPVGMMVWWLVRPAYGWGAAGLSLLAIAVATVLGFGLGGGLLAALSTLPMGLFIALVGGSLLHVVLHRAHPEGSEDDFSEHAGSAWPSWLAPSGLGAVLGAVLLLLLQGAELSSDVGHAGHDGAAGGIFLHLALASAPALVLAYGMAGLVQAFLPKASMEWMGRGSPLSQSMRGVAFGLPLPICSCGVIPVYRTLVVTGAPPAAAMAFLVATPELGLDAVLLSLPLLGGKMTIARVVCATLAALLVGWLVGRRAGVLDHSPGCEVPAGPDPSLSFGARFGAAMRAGYGEIVDGTAPWIVVGLIVAAVAAPVLEAPWLATVPGPLEVALFAALGLPAYVCASGATPVVAVLLAAGVSPGAGIAFLIAGPATNLTTFGILGQLHGRRVAVGFGATMAMLCVVLGTAVNFVVPDAGRFALALSKNHESSRLAELALGVLAVLFLASVLRRGPRAFVAQVFAQAGEDREDHQHDTGQAEVIPASTASCCNSS